MTASAAYVLPPIEADSINTTNVPYGITDAMLTSSTVAETDYTAWNAEIGRASCRERV